MGETITQKEVGYSWKIEKSVTRKIENGAKYPDTEETKVQFFGNTDTLSQAKTEIDDAKIKLIDVLKA